jgi:hypothetical protein
MGAALSVPPWHRNRLAVVCLHDRDPRGEEVALRAGACCREGRLDGRAGAATGAVGGLRHDLPSCG